MQMLLLRFLTRLGALLAIVAGFVLGISSITPGEGTYSLLLILVGTTIGYRTALWAAKRERSTEAGETPAETKQGEEKLSPSGGRRKAGKAKILGKLPEGKHKA